MPAVRRWELPLAAMEHPCRLSGAAVKIVAVSLRYSLACP